MDFNFNIYPVITGKFCKNNSPLETMKILAKTGIKIVQLREKEISKKELYNLAIEFRKITSSVGIALIINDHIDIALAVNADGVHLGQDDLPCSAARKIAPSMVIGISTHNLDEAKTAQENGASYINIGPIFSTSTKETKVSALGIEIIKHINKEISIPFTVMGGIKKHNVRDLLSAGATRFAMVTEITMADNIHGRVDELVAIINNTL